MQQFDQYQQHKSGQKSSYTTVNAVQVSNTQVFYDKTEDDNSFIMYDNALNKRRNMKLILKIVIILALVSIIGIFLFKVFATTLPDLFKHDHSNFSICWQNIKEEDEQYCKKVFILRKLFFVRMDEKDLTEPQSLAFSQMNQQYHYLFYGEQQLTVLIDMWNIKQQLEKDKLLVSDLNTYSTEEKRLLLIFLRLYFHGGQYVHMSLFNKLQNIQSRCLFDVQTGHELLFTKIAGQNDKGIYLPDFNFKFLKINSQNSWILRNIIQKVILKQDWKEVCQNYQCLIVDKCIPS